SRADWQPALLPLTPPSAAPPLPAGPDSSLRSPSPHTPPASAPTPHTPRSAPPPAASPETASHPHTPRSPRDECNISARSPADCPSRSPPTSPHPLRPASQTSRSWPAQPDAMPASPTAFLPRYGSPSP